MFVSFWIKQTQFSIANLSQISRDIKKRIKAFDFQSASGTYSLFIEETSSTDCTNGGFVVSVFGDLNGNGEYDSNSETISNSTTICFPSKESLATNCHLNSIINSAINSEDNVKFGIYIMTDKSTDEIKELEKRILTCNRFEWNIQTS